MTRYSANQARAIPANERFWKYVQTSDDCWIWTGARDKDGYGIFQVCGKARKAHRFAYELIIGPIPEGCDLHHAECENPPCVNPGHVESRTKAEHVLIGMNCVALNARKTHCPNGHEFTPENTWRTKAGQRHCKTCNRERQSITAKLKREGGLIP